MLAVWIHQSFLQVLIPFPTYLTADDQLVNQRVLWSKMLRDGERGAGIVARNWPENVPFGNPNTDLSINHIIALEEALESNNPPTFYWQAS
jgi:hypothetical protein